MELPAIGRLLEIAALLGAAALFGGIIGLQRERVGKAAGLRTHMLVSLGTAFFVLGASEAGLSDEGMSRVIQGLATGIGFIGGGAILKLSREREIRGLTTAASLWMTTAIGVAAGLGLIWVALLGSVLTLIILSVIGRLEHALEHEPREGA